MKKYVLFLLATLITFISCTKNFDTSSERSNSIILTQAKESGNIHNQLLTQFVSEGAVNMTYSDKIVFFKSKAFNFNLDRFEKIKHGIINPDTREETVKNELLKIFTDKSKVNAVYNKLKKVSLSNPIIMNKQIIEESFEVLSTASFNDKCIGYTFLSIYEKSFNFWNNYYTIKTTAANRVFSADPNDPMYDILYIMFMDAVGAAIYIGDQLALNPGYTWADLVVLNPRFRSEANLNSAIYSALAGL
ncbi:MAG: hypothetical protein JST94_11595 [Bacteroidetes bacterium]|nr:hypothetical protein [Bacteroidota bacterium]MBS1641014.1 hypothetical protein [Bacteroidota bacterium]MBS1672070.1 hypothetical protein [Bacteroidota bacterium]